MNFPNSRRGKIASVGFIAAMNGYDRIMLCALAALSEDKKARRLARRPRMLEIAGYFCNVIREEHANESFNQEWDSYMGSGDPVPKA